MDPFTSDSRIREVRTRHTLTSLDTLMDAPTLTTIIEEDVWDLLDFSNVTVRSVRNKPWEPIKMTDTLRRNTANLKEPIAIVRPVILEAIPIKQLDFSKVTIRRR
jgi:hypothetical protein